MGNYLPYSGAEGGQYCSVVEVIHTGRDMSFLDFYRVGKYGHCITLLFVCGSLLWV